MTIFGDIRNYLHAKAEYNRKRKVANAKRRKTIAQNKEKKIVDQKTKWKNSFKKKYGSSYSETFVNIAGALSNYGIKKTRRKTRKKIYPVRRRRRKRTNNYDSW